MDLVFVRKHASKYGLTCLCAAGVNDSRRERAVSCRSLCHWPPTRPVPFSVVRWPEDFGQRSDQSTTRDVAWPLSISFYSHQESLTPLHLGNIGIKVEQAKRLSTLDRNFRRTYPQSQGAPRKVERRDNGGQGFLIKMRKAAAAEMPG